MSEIVFLVEESMDGGYIASSGGASIYTQGDTLEQLKLAIVDAVSCHFASSVDRPQIAIQEVEVSIDKEQRDDPGQEEVL
jgi:hypothetical protein